MVGLMPWLSLPEYARTTGTPESTVRAAIRKGSLRAELEQRAPGDPRTVWRVWLDEPQEASASVADVRVASESDQPRPTLTEPPAAIAGVLALVEADRATIGEQADRIAALSERVGRAEAEAALLRAEVERLRRPWWQRLW